MKIETPGYELKQNQGQGKLDYTQKLVRAVFAKNSIGMKNIITAGILLLLSIQSFSYHWRHVPGKKLYKDLNKALNSKEDVYNLQLYNVNIKGQLSAIGSLDSLQFLSLTKCRLTELPDEIFNLPNLRTIILNYNDFVEIPANISYAKKLEYIAIHNNKLTAIPPEIG
ncbi:leucine-rich repeat domain-containing protein, partial [Okeania hirsuta]